VRRSNDAQRRIALVKAKRIGVALVAGALALATCSCADLHRIAGMGDKPPVVGSPVAHQSKSRPSPTRTARPKSRPVAKVTHVKPIPPSVFAAGSVVRQVRQGKATATLHYWTSQNPSQWAYSDAVTVQVSAELDGVSGEAVAKVRGFKVVLYCGDRTETLRSDRGNFTITPPWSYPSAFTVQCPLRPPHDTARLAVELDVSTETYAGSGSYYLSTYLDSFDLTFPGDQTNG